MKQNRKTIENQKGKNRMKTWIQNGHVLDPLTGTDQIYDVLVDGKDIKKLGTREEIAKNSEERGERSGTGCLRMLCDARFYRSACTFP